MEIYENLHENGTILLHRSGQHYNGLVKEYTMHTPRNGSNIASNRKHPSTRVYSKNDLLTIYNECQTPIPRKVRESLFRMKIWHPQGQIKELVSGTNFTNLIDVNITRKVQSKFVLNLFKVATLNGQSVRNKANNICEYVVDNDLDILTMTETWLTGKKQMRLFMQHFCQIATRSSAPPVRLELVELL